MTLIGPKGLEQGCECALRVIAPELPFQIIYKEIKGPEETFEMNGYRLKAFRVNHNVLCYGYTMEIDRAGKFDVRPGRGSRRFRGNTGTVCSMVRPWKMDGRILTPDMVLGPARKGLKITYCNGYQTDRVDSGECKACRFIYL